MTAAKVMDIISRLPGYSEQAADAVSAYTQVKNGRCINVFEKIQSHNVQIFSYVNRSKNGPNHGITDTLSWCKGSRIRKDLEATGSCWIHFEASNRVRQRRLGTLTGQGQKTHHRRAGYRRTHRALLAKNEWTVLLTQRRPLVLTASTRQTGIRHHRKVRDDALAEKASWAPKAAAQDWDTSDMLGAMGTQERGGWHVSSRPVPLDRDGSAQKVTEAQAHSSCGTRRPRRRSMGTCRRTSRTSRTSGRRRGEISGRCG